MPSTTQGISPVQPPPPVSESARGYILPQKWFQRCPVEVARLLLGAFLCRKDAQGRTHRWRVIETEAYNGTEDLACHASKGLTPRTAVLFGPAGFWHVYLCYGVHWLLNVVTREKGFPSAVLLRGTMEIIPSARQTPPAVFDGPGKVTKAAGVDKRFNAASASRASGLWLESAAVPLPDSQISVTPRIGVDYAGPIWSQKPWRFVVGKQAINHFAHYASFRSKPAAPA